MVERATMNGPPQRHHEPTFLELEQALHIDTLDLITADADQPELFYRIAKLLAGLKAERDATKFMLDEAEAQTQQIIRTTMHSASSATKPTVSQVDAMVRLDPKVKDLGERVVKLDKKVGQAQALKEAYIQRKSSLSDLVDLQKQAGAAIDPAIIRAEMAEQRRAGYKPRR